MYFRSFVSIIFIHILFKANVDEPIFFFKSTHVNVFTRTTNVLSWFTIFAFWIWKKVRTHHEQRMLIRISFWFHTFNSNGSKQQRLFESIGWRSFTRYHLLLIWITWRSWVCLCVYNRRHENECTYFQKRKCFVENVNRRKKRRKKNHRRRTIFTFQKKIYLFPNFNLFNFKQVAKFCLRNDVRPRNE